MRVPHLVCMAQALGFGQASQEHCMCPVSQLLAVRQPTAGEAPLAKLRRVSPRVALSAAAPPLSKLLAAPVRVSLSRSDMLAACCHHAMAQAFCDCPILHLVLSLRSRRASAVSLKRTMCSLANTEIDI